MTTLKVNKRRATIGVGAELLLAVCAAANGILFAGEAAPDRIETATVAAPAYRTTLINPPGAMASYAAGISPSGNVAGGYYTTVSGVTSGFVWRPGTGYTTLNIPGAASTRIFTANDGGSVAGDYINRLGQNLGFSLINGHFSTIQQMTTVYGMNNVGDLVGTDGTNGVIVSGSGGGTVLFFVPGLTTSAMGINPAGQVVGQFTDGFGVVHGFLRDTVGNVTVLDFPGAVSTVCSGINDNMQITGTFADSSNISHGFTYSAGVFTQNDFWSTSGISVNGVLAGYTYAAPSSEAYGFLAVPVTLQLSTLTVSGASATRLYSINNNSALAGVFTAPGGTSHGMLINGNTLTRIDDPNAQTGSTVCRSVNLALQVVGYYTNSSGNSQAFLYAGGNYADVQVPGAVSSVAYGINDAGQITGQYVDVSGVAHGFRFDPGSDTYATIDVPGSFSTYAYGVNNSGLMTLGFFDPSGNFQEAATSTDGVTLSSANVPGMPNIIVQGLNNLGDIAYSLTAYTTSEHAGLRRSGSYYVLDYPGAVVTRAISINDNGFFAGFYDLLGNGSYQGLVARIR